MRTIRLIWIAGLGSIASSCAAPVTHELPPPSARPAPVETRAPALPAAPTDPPPSVVHVVSPGQTLWRIAKAYGVPLEKLAESNGIEDPTRVEVGTALRIPGASRPLDVPPYPLPIPRPEVEGGRLSVGDGSDLVWPVAGGVVLSHFGAARRSHRHAGLDIRGSRGQEIFAARAGLVTFSGTQRGYGKVVIVDHGDGLQTLYAHANALVARQGDHVERGQAIATVGRSGNATTDHVHFEVRRDGVPIDPSPLFQSIAEVLH